MILYLIRNIRTGKEYVGTTTRSLSLRMSDHRYRAREGTRRSPLYDAMRADGMENFSMELLALAESYEELLEKEQAEIRRRNTLHPHGYNLVEGGRGNFGWRMTDETRQKIAAKATGRVGSMRGRKMSEESRARQSAVRKGVTTPKQLIARRANGSSESSRRKISAAAKARWAALSTEERTQRVARLARIGFKPCSAAPAASLTED